MDHSAICAPVHPPMFTHAVNFVNSYRKFYIDEDLFLIFSREEEARLFSLECDRTLYRSIIVDDLYIREGASGIVSRKKFYGLKHIFKNYNYQFVAAVDADSIFIQRKKYSLLFEDFYNRATLYTSISTDLLAHLSIAMDPIAMFKGRLEPFRDMLFRFGATGNYFWFNDIPVYRRDIFSMMWVDLDLDEPACINSNFDFIIYGCYSLVSNWLKHSVLTHKDGSPLVSPRWSVLEDQHLMSSETFNALARIIQPMWLVQPEKCDSNERVFMKLHADRDQLCLT